MKKSDILLLNHALSQPSLLKLTGAKFAYAVARNLQIIKPEVEALQKAQEPSEEFTKYDTARAELAKKHAEKDEKGEPKTKIDPATMRSSYVVEDMKALEEEVSKLKEEHKEAIEARETQVKEYNTMLEEEVSVELHKLNINELPSDISAKQMSEIISIIQD